MAKLGGKVDANDSFARGHGVVKARSYKREIPLWAKNDKEIQKLLLSSFPKLATNDNQRAAAGRWATVIHLYFRLGYTRGQIAEELCTTTERVKGVIRSIYRSSVGRRANGSGVKKQCGAPKQSY